MGFSDFKLVTANFIYQNYQHNKVNILRDFANETPMHSSASHAFSKIRGKFQNRDPRELIQNFDIPRISMIH